MLVSIRKLELDQTSINSGVEGNSSLIRILSDFGGAITAKSRSGIRSSGPFWTIPSDWCPRMCSNSRHGIQETRKLATYRLVEANGRMSHAALTQQSQFGDLSNKVVATRSPMLLADPGAVRAEGGASLPGLTGYLGIPLIAGDELVGVLEAGQTGTSPIRPQEFDLLRLIAPQISTALRNSILYEQERRRSLEYSGLAGVAQAIGSGGQSRQLFERLVEACRSMPASWVSSCWMRHAANWSAKCRSAVFRHT